MVKASTDKYWKYDAAQCSEPSATDSEVRQLRGSVRGRRPKDGAGGESEHARECNDLMLCMQYCGDRNSITENGKHEMNMD